MPCQRQPETCNRHLACLWLVFKLGKKYDAAHTWGYEEYEDCLQRGDVDAVFIALPNSMHAEGAEMETIKDGKKQRRKFGPHDQFAAELIYFSDCVLRDQESEPSGTEGLLDVHIVRSLYESAEKGRPVRIKERGRNRRPQPRQEFHRPPVRSKPKMVGAQSPSP